MKDSLLSHFRKTISLGREKEEYVLSKFNLSKIKKRDFLLESNTTCQYLSYVRKGCLRIYNIDDYLLESNVYFAVDDWWAVDLKSYIECSPARFNIQALTDCEILAIHKLNFNQLLNDVPELERWFRILLQNALIASENRINYKMSFTAEQRYLEFIKKYPTLESQISQKHVASYLGITAEYLSKIKAKRSKRKS